MQLCIKLCCTVLQYKYIFSQKKVVTKEFNEMINFNNFRKETPKPLFNKNEF